MKTITLYELLWLINDDKAPERIKISELIYNFNNERQEYFDEDGNELSDNIHLTRNLNHPVEILEENKIPEKIKDKYCSQISKVELAQKCNEIIDYLIYSQSKGGE